MSKKPQISRRTFLTAAGTAGLVLPQLEFFARSDTAFADDAGLPKFMGVFMANGNVSGEWRCSGTETSWTLGPDLANLRANQANITVLQGIDNVAGFDSQRLNGDANHWVAATSFLTGCHYDFGANPGTTLRLGQNFASIDQRIAASSTLPLRSLVMGLQEIDFAPSGDDRGHVGYLSGTSWVNQTTQASRSSTSAQVFRDIFGVDPGMAGTPPDPMAAPNTLRSVLDSVLSQRDRFVTRLGTNDRARMERYFDAVRALEQSVVDEERLVAISCTSPTGEFETSTSLSMINERARNMARLAAAALSCGVTRVVSHMLANEHNYGPSDAMAGVLEDGAVVQHHNASHYDFEGSLPMAKAFVGWQVGLYNDILDELTAAGILDDSIVLFGSGMGDGQAHSFDNLPLILGGGGAGRLRPGRLLDKSDHLADVLLTLLNLSGVTAESQADSTTVLDYL